MPKRHRPVEKPNEQSKFVEAPEKVGDEGAAGSARDGLRDTVTALLAGGS